MLLLGYQVSRAQHDNRAYATVISPGADAPTVISGNLYEATYTEFTPYRISWSTSTLPVPTSSARDQWVKFTAESGNYEIFLTSPDIFTALPVSFNISVQLFEKSMSSDSLFYVENIEIYKHFYAGGGYIGIGEGGTIDKIRKGKEYYIRISTTSPAHSMQSYEVEIKKIEDSVPNEEAWTATTLIIDAPCTALTTYTYGSMYHNEPILPCIGDVKNRFHISKTMWYKFIAPPSGLVRVVSNIEYQGDTYIASASLFQYTGGDETNYENYEILKCGLLDVPYAIRGSIYSGYLTPGEEYYIQIATTDTYWGDEVCFQVEEVIAEDISTEITGCSSYVDNYYRHSHYYDTSTAFRYHGWADLGHNEYYELETPLIIPGEEDWPIDYSYNYTILAQLRNTTSGINLRSGITFNANKFTGGIRSTTDGRQYSNVSFHIDNSYTASGDYDVVLYFKESEMSSLGLTETNYVITRVPGACTATTSITPALETTMADIIPTAKGYNATTGVRWVKFTTPELGMFFIRKTHPVNGVIDEIVNNNCLTSPNGHASVSVSGGVAPYIYSWYNATTSTLMSTTTDSVSYNLDAGTYYCVVTDQMGANDTVEFEIINSGLLSATSTNTMVSCNGGSNGTITVTPSGGTAPYTISWVGSSTSFLTRTGLAAGTYSYIITDANSCTVEGSSTIIEPLAALSLDSVVTMNTCHEGNTGSISVTVSGGTPGYTYSWSNGATTSSVEGLEDGTYTVSIYDMNACYITASYTITSPMELTASLSETDVNCYGGNDGSITSIVSGGTAPYTYSWSSGETTSDISSKSAGTYTLTITDGNGCTAVVSAVIDQPTLDTVDMYESICKGAYSSRVGDYVTSPTTIYETLTSSLGCDSTIAYHIDVTFENITLESHIVTSEQVSNTAYFTNAECQAVAVISSPYDLGEIEVNVQTSYPLPHVDSGIFFVDRVFDINVEHNHSATVTLYFTQEEIDAYNALVGPTHPLYPQIGFMGEHMLITAEHLIDVDGEMVAVREALDCDGIWNEAMNRWEVTFEATGFSTFYLHTDISGYPLSTLFTQVNAKAEEKMNVVEWTISTHNHLERFIIEKSTDGKNFSKIGEEKYKPGINMYQYLDYAPSAIQDFYRIIAVGSDGKSNYSHIVKVTKTQTNSSIELFPNPTEDLLHVVINDKGGINNDAQLKVIDVQGRVLQSVHIQQEKTTISLKDYPAGNYYIQIMNGSTMQTLKVTKR